VDSASQEGAVCVFLSARMAFYGWIADVRCATLADALSEVLRRPDLKTDAEYSRDGLLFAGDPVMVLWRVQFPISTELVFVLLTSAV
jgi:hypothetical protein